MTAFKIPKKFPEAYIKSLSEVERRQTFNQCLVYMCDKLKSLTQEEKKLRDDFNNNYGKYLPIGFN